MMADSKINFHTEKRRLRELIPYEHNPRQLSKKQAADLKKSLKKFSLAEIPVVNTDNTILAGHQRLKILTELEGVDFELDVRVPNRTLTEKEAQEYLIRSNKNTGEWDFDELANSFGADDLLDWGFDESELAGFVDYEEIQEDEVSGTPQEAVSKHGEIYQLGDHRLMCGDATSLDDVQKLVSGRAVDMLLIDPPYNAAYEGKTKDRLTIQNDKMDADDFLQFLCDSFATADVVMRPGAVFYIWHAEKERRNFQNACEAVDWKVSEYLIWNKSAPTFVMQDYHCKHEPCLYGWKKGAHKWYGDRKQTTVIDFDKPHRNGEHPTMKPVELFAYLVKNSTCKGETVLDLFGGSGTTLIACEQLNRSCKMMELDPKYCDVIRKRWWKLTHNNDETGWKEGTKIT